MNRTPTDRKILKKIHDRYYEQFIAFERGDPSNERETKIYVPMDCQEIASDLGVDGDIVFGRFNVSLRQ